MDRRTAALCLPALALGWPPGQAGAQALPVASADGRPPSSEGHPAFELLRGRIEAEYPDVESVVVLRQGRVLFDHPSAGAGTLRDLQSVTKSVLSLAVGAALARGAIQSLDQSVGELLGVVESADAAASSPPVTIRHLLTMTAGFRTQERFPSASADDPVFLLRRERAAASGAVFAYDNLGANLLAIVLETATGQSASRFAEEVIFRPLGIAAHDWQRGPQGHCLGFSGLRLRTRDMARLGELALSAGAWAGQTILAPAYARAAVAAQNAGGRPVGLAYGYLWWVVPSAHERRTFLASGWGGQFIWVHPPLDLVIATTATVSSESNRRGQALALIRGELFRAAAAAAAAGA